MSYGSDPTGTISATRGMFTAGRSCGECLLLATDGVENPARDVLLRAVKGISAGRAGVCSLLVAGLLVIAERDGAESDGEVPYNDLLETFVPEGGPGSRLARGNSRLNEFKRRFEERVRGEFAGIRCAEISNVDWGAASPVGSPSAFPDDKCVELADATISDLNEILEP